MLRRSRTTVIALLLLDTGLRVEERRALDVEDVPISARRASDPQSHGVNKRHHRAPEAVTARGWCGATKRVVLVRSVARACGVRALGA
jgi:integrase